MSGKAPKCGSAVFTAQQESPPIHRECNHMQTWSPTVDRETKITTHTCPLGPKLHKHCYTCAHLTLNYHGCFGHQLLSAL